MRCVRVKLGWEERAGRTSRGLAGSIRAKVEVGVSISLREEEGG